MGELEGVSAVVRVAMVEDWCWRVPKEQQWDCQSPCG